MWTLGIDFSFFCLLFSEASCCDRTVLTNTSVIGVQNPLTRSKCKLFFFLKGSKIPKLLSYFNPFFFLILQEKLGFLSYVSMIMAQSSESAFDAQHDNNNNQLYKRPFSVLKSDQRPAVKNVFSTGALQCFRIFSFSSESTFWQVQYANVGIRCCTSNQPEILLIDDLSDLNILACSCRRSDVQNVFWVINERLKPTEV